ncbi:hypothetical protein NXS19_013078 [Fusarium pseudograminearum]|nr:hypothetical protein NXS19_013078 [Fusarium pseudograminearum]
MASRYIQTLRSRVKATHKPWPRSYHSAVARFTTIDPRGAPISFNTGIMVGEPNQNYIYIEPEVGNAIRAAIIRQLGSGVVNDTATLSLQFDHDSKHFAHMSLPLPRINISQNLGRHDSKISPATLWLSGNWYAITLDGTPDESFERASRETAYRLKGALERLKDS